MMVISRLKPDNIRSYFTQQTQVVQKIHTFLLVEPFSFTSRLPFPTHDAFPSPQPQPRNTYKSKSSLLIIIKTPTNNPFVSPSTMAPPLLFLFYLILITSLSTTATTTITNTITATQTLSGNATIVSSGGNFVLGFYQPDTTSSRYYVSMWYNKVTIQTIVWVANRDAPVQAMNIAELKFSNGNLALFQNGSSNNPVWSTDADGVAVMAVLLDDGNLVLRDEKNVTVWQSFDNPTHTWLPGAKLGLNKKTKKNQLLTVWKNKEDPAPGLYSLMLDPDGTSQYVIKWNDTVQYWTSGDWDEQTKAFTLVPEMTEAYIYTFTFTDNENESYFTYRLTDTNSSTITRLVMDVTGQIKQLTWLDNTQQWNQFWSQPRQQCEVYDYCGTFGSCSQNNLQSCSCLDGFEPVNGSDWWGLSDYSSGCRRTTRLKCGTRTALKDQDKFRVYDNIGFPDNQLSVGNATGLDECESACYSNCSCTAYAFDSTCFFWTGDLLNLNSTNASTTGALYVRLAASDFPTSNKTMMVVSIAAGSAAGILFAMCLALVLWRQRRQRIGATRTVEGSLVAFTFKDLQTATKNFSEKLGGGGFGSVFKGTLPDSSVIAVKKLESITQGEKQFRSEVSTIGTIQHVNLVRLRGFCSEGAKKLLVYDLMPNRSLDAHLFREKGGKLLDWKTRYQIALGTARGLAYLHEKCRDCIIHCDIKPENILLDAEFCPKVADFGLAKLVGRDFSRVLTTMRGTRGYLAPEWISGVAITAKADIYSYGMMLFELISGRRNTEQSEDGKISFFPTWAASRVREGVDIISILDPRLEGDANAEEVTKICKVACWCIQDDEIQRPSSGQVVQILEGVLDVNMPPMPRSLQVFIDNHENIVFYTESSSSQSSQERSNTTSSSSQTTANASSISTKSEV
ncbi:hypothetical protein Drorol1_Dr00019368 [Drosera rotundifolia]